jgi:hypothetical protein
LLIILKGFLPHYKLPFWEPLVKGKDNPDEIAERERSCWQSPNRALLKSSNDKESQMSANVLSFTPAPFPQEAVIVSNGDHRAAVAAARTDRRAEAIERLPFDLSALEEEGVFIVRRVTRY